MTFQPDVTCPLSIEADALTARRTPLLNALPPESTRTAVRLAHRRAPKLITVKEGFEAAKHC
jgi:hypothetical protein